jgi:hypothetical protein
VEEEESGRQRGRRGERPPAWKKRRTPPAWKKSITAAAAGVHDGQLVLQAALVSKCCAGNSSSTHIQGTSPPHFFFEIIP